MILKLEEKDIELHSLLYEYLYPYLLRFSIKCNIKWENGSLYIHNNEREEFCQMLENIFNEFMKECYKEPSHKQRSKHPSRYEKIEFGNNIYILDYRTDIIGIIGYGLNSLIREIKTN